ncbi:MAG TPA: APC family permease, partial [Parafilimonas sp.]
MQIKQLKRTLSLRDLVFFNLVAVVSITSLATAAKTGVTGLTLFLIGAIFFFIPEGLAVNSLSSKYPNEGGIYSWTKILFGNRNGFLCGWCYWINNILYLPSLVLSTAVIATYIFQKGNSLFGERMEYILPFTLIVLWFTTLINIRGLKQSRWLQNVGGMGAYLPFIFLAFSGLYALITQHAANSFNASNWKPDWNNFSYLNLWATVPFAYTGLELSSTLAAEIKNPNRNLPLSVYIAAPLIGLFYIIGSGCLLYIVPKENIDVIGGCFQAISLMMNKLSSNLWWIVLLAAACATVGRIGGLGAWMSGAARVALVAGIDKYLPAAFARIHPRWHTPHTAILIQSMLATFFLLMAIIGKGTTVATAFFTLLDMSIVLYFIPYI